MLAFRLNLLPPEKKEDLKKVYILAYAQTMISLLFIVVVFVCGLLIPVRLMLTNDYEDLSKQTSPTEDEYTISVGEISVMNALLTRVEGIQKRLPLWSDALVMITSLIPANIRLDNVTVGADGNITLRGTAADRDDLLKLQDNLKRSPQLSNIASPLSNILQRKDVRFELEMKYSPAAK